MTQPNRASSTDARLRFGIAWKTDTVPKPPDSTKSSLKQRLNAHAREHWPGLERVEVRFRAEFAFIDSRLPDGDVIKLCRLRYGGSASHWGFAMYRASRDDYEDSVLPTGMFGGTAEDALDCAAGLYVPAYE